MRKHFPSFLLLALAGCGGSSQGASAVDADLAITNVGVIDAERGTVVPDRTVLIKANRIVDVGPALKARLASGVSHVYIELPRTEIIEYYNMCSIAF